MNVGNCGPELKKKNRNFTGFFVGVDGFEPPTLPIISRDDLNQ